MNPLKADPSPVDLSLDVVKSVPPAFLLTPFSQYPIKTQVVIDTPTMAVPLYRRRYRLPFYLLDGVAVNYEGLLEGAVKKKERFTGTSAYPSIYLDEVFEDAGNDGHVNQVMVGWKYSIE